MGEAVGGCDDTRGDGGGRGVVSGLLLRDMTSRTAILYRRPLRMLLFLALFLNSPLNHGFSLVS